MSLSTSSLHEVRDELEDKLEHASLGEITILERDVLKYTHEKRVPTLNLHNMGIEVSAREWLSEMLLLCDFNKKSNGRISPSKRSHERLRSLAGQVAKEKLRRGLSVSSDTSTKASEESSGGASNELEPKATLLASKIPRSHNSWSSGLNVAAESPATIQELLALLELEKYQHVFDEHEVDFDALLLLSANELIRMGIPLGPRKKISHAIAQLSDPTFVPTSPSLTPTMTMGYSWEIDFNDVVLGPLIGSGTFGTVHEGNWNDTKCAVKQLHHTNITNERIRDFEKEIELLSLIQHPRVVQFYGACITPPHVCLITKFYPRGSLTDVLKGRLPDHPLREEEPSPTLPAFPLKWPQLVQFAIDVVKGMVYLHSLSPAVLHRDLKSPNILVGVSYKCSIGDFGLCRFDDDSTTLEKTRGSPLWMAPEVMVGGKGFNYNKNCDVYSFGIILWEIVARWVYEEYKKPYFDLEIQNPIQLFYHITKLEKRPALDGMNANVRDVIERCVDRQCEDRPTFADLLPLLLTLQASKTPRTINQDSYSDSDSNNGVRARTDSGSSVRGSDYLSDHAGSSDHEAVFLNDSQATEATVTQDTEDSPVRQRYRRRNKFMWKGKSTSRTSGDSSDGSKSKSERGSGSYSPYNGDRTDQWRRPRHRARSTSAASASNYAEYSDNYEESS